MTNHLPSSKDPMPVKASWREFLILHKISSEKLYAEFIRISPDLKEPAAEFLNKINELVEKTREESGEEKANNGVMTLCALAIMIQSISSLLQEWENRSAVN
jgi:hypothetical protein